MGTIGVRALQQNASAVLKRVEKGELIEVTDRGRPVALLAPLHGDVRARLSAAGRLAPAIGDLLELGEPLVAKRGTTRPSAKLQSMRSEER